jgi:hypothetical protein
VLRLIPLLAISGLAHAQSLEPGERVENALVAQVTEEGLNRIEVIAQTLVPDLLPTDLLDIGDLDFGVGVINNVQPQLTVGGVDLVPRNGELSINVGAFIGVNSAAEPFYIEAACLFGGCLCESDAYIDPLPITLELTVDLQVYTPPEGPRQYDATVDLGTLDIAISGSDFNFIDGGFGCDVVGTLAGLFGPALVSFLQPEIAGAIVELEPTIEEALNQAVFEDSLEVLETTLDVSVEPKAVNITPAGIELAYSGVISAPQAECIADLDPLGSLETFTPVPGIASLPSRTEIAAQVSDELVNQALYAAYRGGILCFTVDESAGLDLPINLDSSLLELLGGDGFPAIVGDETKPLVIQTLPREVPTAVYGGTNDVGLALEDLELRFFTEVDGRMAKAIGMSIDADVGADVIFDGSTGELSLGLDLTSEAFDIQVVPDYLVAGVEQDIEEGVTGLVDTLIPALIGDLLGGPLLTLPAFEGLGLTSLDLYASGAQQDWLTAEAGVGIVDYADPAGGCDEDPATGESGCDSGCESGCSSTRSPLGGYLLALTTLWFLRRRRR